MADDINEREDPHTPPWYIGADGRVYAGEGSCKDTVADFLIADRKGTVKLRAAASAHLAVRAVNAHSALLEVARSIIAHFEQGTDGDRPVVTTMRFDEKLIYKAAQAAVKKATQ